MSRSADAEALRRMARELEELERVDVLKEDQRQKMVIVPDWFASAYSRALRGIAGRMDERKAP